MTNLILTKSEGSVDGPFPFPLDTVRTTFTVSGYLFGAVSNSWANETTVFFSKFAAPFGSTGMAIFFGDGGFTARNALNSWNSLFSRSQDNCEWRVLGLAGGGGDGTRGGNGIRMLLSIRQPFLIGAGLIGLHFGCLAMDSVTASVFGDFPLVLRTFTMDPFDDDWEIVGDDGEEETLESSSSNFFN